MNEWLDGTEFDGEDELYDDLVDLDEPGWLDVMEDDDGDGDD